MPEKEKTPAQCCLPIPSGPLARRHLLPRHTPPTVVASSRRLPRAFSPARRCEAEGGVRGREEAGSRRQEDPCRRCSVEDLARAGGGARARAYCAALVGPAGVGKTAIVEGLAQRIAAGNVPDTLVGARIVEVAGTHWRGMFEQRFKDAIKQAEEAQGKVILFIDEMHMVVGAGGDRGGPVDAANIGRSPWRSR
ncbi:ATP-dependent Clp protease ATP-binding subunit clpC [Hordeum vulgare]|nr:ATP-dependent Clp protease ATP-binding subunit clpC [Hordeum vulgare]